MISELAVNKRAISCNIAPLSTFTCRIVRIFVRKGLVLIFKRREDIYKPRIEESEGREGRGGYNSYR